jgi:hypothetical protein
MVMSFDHGGEILRVKQTAEGAVIIVPGTGHG